MHYNVHGGLYEWIMEADNTLESAMSGKNSAVALRNAIAVILQHSIPTYSIHNLPEKNDLSNNSNQCIVVRYPWQKIDTNYLDEIVNRVKSELPQIPIKMIFDNLYVTQILVDQIQSNSHIPHVQSVKVNYQCSIGQLNGENEVIQKNQTIRILFLPESFYDIQDIISLKPRLEVNQREALLSQLKYLYSSMTYPEFCQLLQLVSAYSPQLL